MSIPDKIIKEIEMLREQEGPKVLDKIKEKYRPKGVILWGENYSWWDNEEDDIYNEQGEVWLADIYRHMANEAAPSCDGGK